MWKSLSQFFLSFFDSNILSQFIKYIITGLFTVSLDYALLYTLTNTANIHYLVSKSISFVTVFGLNFLLMKYWTFKVMSNSGRQLLLYILLMIFKI